MIINSPIVTNLKITKLEDLHKLKPLMESTNFKINKSQIARELGVDRRTVGKYINGFRKSKHRSSTNCLTPYTEIIRELLSDENEQLFYYRRVLRQKLRDNHDYRGSYSNFCYYLNLIPEFKAYFDKRRPASPAFVRYETPAGKQAQLDWKESLQVLTTDRGWVEINIFVLLLSFSRYRVYRMSMSKTQDVLLALLDNAFQTFGGVPQEIVTDNMKTVMDEPRTKGSKGKVNIRFQQFADDYGFHVHPCIAGRPQTKAKVEAPMKLLDEIRAYNGKLDYYELNKLVERINNRVNIQVNQGTGRIPMMYFKKEKASLCSLPADTIRKPYQIPDHTVKVNHSSMFQYRGCQYSVPPEYVDRYVSLQVYDGYIHVYYNTKLITIHTISKNKLNYHSEDYAAIARISHVFREEKIADRAKENLEMIGRIYGYE